MNNVYMGLDVEDFIFGDETSYEESYNVTEEEMNKFGIIECVEDPDVACYRIALENEQNHNAIMTAMMQREYQVLESTGREMIYEGAKLNQFFDMVKTQIQKFWAKIKGVFKKVMDQINSIVLSNKAFAKKYRGANVGTLKKDKGFTGYPFDNGEVKVPDYAKALEVISKDAVERAMSSSESKIANAGLEAEYMNKIRGAVIGKSDVDASEFAKELKKYFYGSENTVTVQIKDQNFGSLLDKIENSAAEKKSAKIAYKEVESFVKLALSETNKAKAEAEKEDDQETVRTLKTFGNLISKSLTVMSTALNVQTSAIVACAAQNRKIANYWVRTANKKGGVERTNESFEGFEGIEVELI